MGASPASPSLPAPGPYPSPATATANLPGRTISPVLQPVSRIPTQILDAAADAAPGHVAPGGREEEGRGGPEDGAGHEAYDKGTKPEPAVPLVEIVLVHVLLVDDLVEFFVVFVAVAMFEKFTIRHDHLPRHGPSGSEALAAGIPGATPLTVG